MPSHASRGLFCVRSAQHTLQLPFTTANSLSEQVRVSASMQNYQTLIAN